MTQPNDGMIWNPEAVGTPADSEFGGGDGRNLGADEAGKNLMPGRKELNELHRVHFSDPADVEIVDL